MTIRSRAQKVPCFHCLPSSAAGLAFRLKVIAARSTFTHALTNHSKAVLIRSKAALIRSKAVLIHHKAVLIRSKAVLITTCDWGSRAMVKKPLSDIAPSEAPRQEAPWTPSRSLSDIAPSEPTVVDTIDEQTTDFGSAEFVEEVLAPSEPTVVDTIDELTTDWGSVEFVEEVLGPKDPLMEFASLLDTDYVLWFLRFHAKELDCHAKSGEEALNALLRDVEAADEALEHLDAMQGRADVAIVDLKRSAEAMMEAALGEKYVVLSFAPSKRYRSRNRSGEVS